MKDKKDGKNRASYTNGPNLNLNTSPLATSTADALHSYHQHQYYQPSSTYPSQFDYNHHPTMDAYDITTNYSMKQSNYYTNGHNPKINYDTSFPPTSYYHHQQSDPVLSPFI